MAKHQEPGLGGREPSKSLQKRPCLFHTFGAGVVFRVVLRPYRRTQEVHCPVLVHLHALWKGPPVDDAVRPSTDSENTLAGVELKTDLAPSGSKAGKCGSDSAGPPSKAPIVEEGKGLDLELSLFFNCIAILEEHAYRKFMKSWQSRDLRRAYDLGTIGA